MGEKSPNFFIDTNIIVDYIFFKETEKELDNFKQLKDSLKQNSDFLDFYFKNKEKVDLCTSFINLCEIASVLIENIIKGRLYLKNIPFNYFDKYLSNFLKQKSFRKEIKEIITKYYKFLKENKIWFIHTLSIQTPKDFNEVDRLKIEFKLPSIDALIFSIASKEGGFFVTNDAHHFLDNKKLKKEYDKIIKIISPEEALRLIKKITPK